MFKYDNLNIADSSEVFGKRQFTKEDFNLFGTAEIYDYYTIKHEETLKEIKELRMKLRGCKITLSRTMKLNSKGSGNYTSMIASLNDRIDKYERKVNKLEKKVVDKKTFIAIIKTYNVLILEELMKGKTYIIGYRLGALRVICRKHNPNKKRVNYNLTKKIGKPVYYTDKYYLDFNWIKLFTKVLNNSVYSFTASYSDTHKNCAKDMLKKEMNKGEQEYYKFQMMS